MTHATQDPPHPPWCDRSACEVATGGAHRGTAARVNLRRNEPPRLLILLTQTPGQPVRVRLVIIGNLIINEITLSIDEAHLAQAALVKVIAQAAPPAPEPESGPIGTRH